MTTRTEHDEALKAELDLFERAAGRDYTRDEQRLLKRYRATRNAFLDSISDHTKAGRYGEPRGLEI